METSTEIEAKAAPAVQPKKRRERGRGHIFRPKFKTKDGQKRECPNFWIQYYWCGVAYRENTHSDKITVAEKLLLRRLGQMQAGKFVGTRVEKVRFNELAEDIRRDYRNEKNRSIDRLERSLGYLSRFFGNRRMIEIGTDLIEQYKELRKRQPGDEGAHEGLSTGASSATINRELAALKRMFHLGMEQEPPKVLRTPRIKMLKENNRRTGFLEHEQYRQLRDALPDYVRPILVLDYHSGVRIEEALGLQWEQNVDLLEKEVCLDPEMTKNEEARILPLEGEILETLKMQRELRDAKYPDCPWVFFRDGKRIKNFYKAWRNACVKVGLGRFEKQEDGREKYFGLIPHDLRRTAIRNLVRAGVPERVAMDISGHKTRSVFERYNITSRRDRQEAARRLSSYLSEKNRQSTDKVADLGAEQSHPKPCVIN